MSAIDPPKQHEGSHEQRAVVSDLFDRLEGARRALRYFGEREYDSGRMSIGDRIRVNGLVERLEHITREIVDLLPKELHDEHDPRNVWARGIGP